MSSIFRILNSYMNNKPVIILASARKNSNTKVFLERIFKNKQYRVIDLLDFIILPYDYSAKYPENDDFFKIVEEIIQHNVIGFATPVYWYAMSGPMKIFFDRFTDLITIKKPFGRQLKDKSTFLIAVGTDKEFPEGFEKPFELSSRYLQMFYLGHIYNSTKHPASEQLMEDLIESFIHKIENHLPQSTGS